MDAEDLVPTIRKLDEVVINRIAAGEVVQRPANALKEMLENSMDAGSSSITVSVKQGGLKLLQIQDNGCGIRRDDMGIVCERFTTSKLQAFEDLTSIATFGFRGEALASISHVAHLSITTKTADSVCAYSGCYLDGQLKEPVKSCAGNKGTQITVEDLFYNVPTRRKSLRSASEEHCRILDVMTRYAVHNCQVALCLKKHGELSSDMRTDGKASQRDNIRLLFGASVARELLDLTHTDDQYKFTAKALFTNANYSAKKCTLLLFINNRLVESNALKKAIETVYINYLPKGGHPFIYLSLSLAPESVDVNVHPTKHEVHFLYESEIIESVQRAVDARLLSANSSRSYLTQTLLPGVVEPSTDDTEKPRSNTSAHKMVRTDSSAQKLEAFLKRPRLDHHPDSGGNTKTSDTMEEGGVVSDVLTAAGGKRSRAIELTSVLELRQEIQHSTNPGVRRLVQDHTFVGCVDEELVLLQHETSLYLVNIKLLSSHLFYQIVVYDFGNLGYFKLTEQPTIRELALLALQQPSSGWKPEDGSKSDLADYVHTLLLNKAEMLDDYFSLTIDQEGRLLALPLLLKDYKPPLSKLPLFILQLATKVDWENEKSCFNTFASTLSKFYACQKDPLQPACSKPNPSQVVGTWQWQVEHAVCPAIRKILLPPNQVTSDGTFIQLANLPDLYRVFERC